jgi:hypothetical protein
VPNLTYRSAAKRTISEIDDINMMDKVCLDEESTSEISTIFHNLDGDLLSVPLQNAKIFESTGSIENERSMLNNHTTKGSKRLFSCSVNGGNHKLDGVECWDEQLLFWTDQDIQCLNEPQIMNKLSQISPLDQCTGLSGSIAEDILTHGQGSSVENSASPFGRTSIAESSAVSDIGPSHPDAYSAMISVCHSHNSDYIEDCLRVADGSLVEGFALNPASENFCSSLDGFADRSYAREIPHKMKVEDRVQRVVTVIEESGFESIEDFLREYFALDKVLSREIK